MLSRAVMRSIDMNKTLLVTGAAGFIGSHVTQALLVRGDTAVGLDNLNGYYDHWSPRYSWLQWHSFGAVSFPQVFDSSPQIGRLPMQDFTKLAKGEERALA